MSRDNGTSLFINYTIQLECHAMNKGKFLNIKRYDMQNLNDYNKNYICLRSDCFITTAFLFIH